MIRSASLLKLAICAALLTFQTGCADLPGPEPASILDERTGITLTVVDEPLLLARERRDIAANARDYLTLVAVTRNESGRVSPFLLVYRWSTIDERVYPRSTPAAASLVLLADGRDIRPTALARTPADLENMSESLWRPDVTRFSTYAYRIDVSVLAFIASSQQLSGWFEAPGEALPYQMWRDGRAALKRFSIANGAPVRGR